MNLLSTQQEGVYVNRKGRVALAAIAQTRPVTIHDDGMSAPIDWLAAGGAQHCKDCLDGKIEGYNVLVKRGGLSDIDPMDVLEAVLNDHYEAWERDNETALAERQRKLVLFVPEGCGWVEAAQDPRGDEYRIRISQSELPQPFVVSRGDNISRHATLEEAKAAALAFRQQDMNLMQGE